MTIAVKDMLKFIRKLVSHNELVGVSHVRIINSIVMGVS